MTVDEEVVAVLLAIILIVGAFTVSQTVFSGSVVDAFSELAILGPDGTLGGYPDTVVADHPFQLFLYVGNHEGHVMYYRVLVKLGDHASNVSETQPLDASPLLTCDSIIQHGGNHTVPVTVTLSESGDNQRLIFELWTYDHETDLFQYHSRYCQLWLSVTQP